MKRISHPGWLPLFAVLGAIVAVPAYTRAQTLATNGLPAVIERGTYVNYFSCQNPAYAIFSHFGDDSGADSRLGQLLLGWNTAANVPTNQPSVTYLIRRCRATITLNNGNQVAYDPTHDDYRTFFETNHPSWLPDEDEGRPIELFGVGYRNGHSSLTFTQCTEVGNGDPGSNNVFGVMWFTNGQPVDIGNNVGKTSPEFPPFETWPFAVAQTENAAPGQLMLANSKLTFDLNLADPFVTAYLQRGLRDGRVRLMVSSLHQVSGQFGSEPYPAFTTRFNQAVLNPPTTLDLEVTAVRPLDSDGDDLPDDWEQFHFSSLTNSAAGDADLDGADNANEFQAGTDPANAASAFEISVQLSSPAVPTLRWPNLPSRRFEIHYSDDLATWHALTNPPLWFPTPNQAVWSETNHVPGRFYRVRAIAE